MYPNLRAEMARYRITGAEIAELLGILPSTVSSKINGKTDFTLSEAVKIKEFLHTSLTLEELFERG